MEAKGQQQEGSDGGRCDGMPTAHLFSFARRKGKKKNEKK